MWGISNSNYSGAMGMELNPAIMVGTHYRWELHLLSADAFMMNNYMYLKKNSKAIKTSIKGEAVAQDAVTDKYTTNDKKGYASTFIKYPGFIYSGNRTAVGFHISTRLALSARGLPYHLAKFMKEGFDYTPQQNIHFTGSGAKAVAINWHEAGLSGGTVLHDDKSAYITGAITLNYLYGLNSFYMLIDDIDYIVPSDSLWQINIANVEYGHAVPDKGAGAGDVLAKKGSGFSTTLGIQYYRNRNENAYRPCTKDVSEKKYDYRVGFSLIDIGKIKFKKQSSKYIFTNVGSDWYGIDTVKFNSIAALDSTLNTQFLNSIDGGKKADQYSLTLPAAASLQFDYSVTPTFYVNLSVIQRLPLGDYAVKRANQVSITARYETRRFEIAVPYSLYNYYRNRIGLAIRYGILVIGTDMIGPFTGISNAYGFDFFVGIKYQFFGECSQRNGNRRARGGPDKCYTY